MILRHWQTICATPTIVEGAGGLLVPINKNFLIRDLIKLLNLRLVIVANTIVGTINHILLTIEAATSANINITGIILFGNQNPWLIETLREFTLIPIIAEIPWLNSLHQQSLKYISRSLFNKNILNTLFDKSKLRAHAKP
jgi:dethiobiotin synthetase